MRPRAYLAWAWVLIAAGVILVFETTRLPFTAGSPAADLLAPISALACGGAAIATAWKALRAGGGPWFKALTLVTLVLALLVAAAASLVLAFIFLMCGTYWAQDAC